ncbi:hypothetical protein FANTH_8187 [Fusarium anthophilum]|uniref:Nucleoside phosphorylase domain-containing protein n=1 Tax=Fusarium anthophilum TaxID=48485 RepID=A0A8H5E1U2_9HYPO|nr:hypothetical protein FANTH_8187 [Fusarium anthophilum]
MPPTDDTSFRVAIVCALPREAAAMSLLFDELWDEMSDDGKGTEQNTYVTGRIGQHNVVLATLPGMGTIHAARVTVKLRGKYRRLRLALLVGICGGMPRIANQDAFLGDVVISKSVVQYDYGKQYPRHFKIMKYVEDSLASPYMEIRSLLANIEAELVDQRLKRASTVHLKYLQNAAKQDKNSANYQYPGAVNDKLYSSDYHHKHKKSCSECTSHPTAMCIPARKASCLDLECDPSRLVQRRRVSNLPVGADYVPQLFMGRIGSANCVVKSGTDRDDFATRNGIIAFEMEGAGMWDTIPCIVVKGICDYADSHKKKDWQDYASATAASVAKAIVERYPLGDSDAPSAPLGDLRGANQRSVASNSARGGTWVNQGHATSMPGPGQVPGEYDPRDPSRFPVRR